MSLFSQKLSWFPEQTYFAVYILKLFLFYEIIYILKIDFREGKETNFANWEYEFLAWTLHTTSICIHKLSKHVWPQLHSRHFKVLKIWKYFLVGQIFPVGCMQQERERVGEREGEIQGAWQGGREITEKILTMILHMSYMWSNKNEVFFWMLRFLKKNTRFLDPIFIFYIGNL